MTENSGLPTDSLRRLEQRLGYSFSNRSLLDLALTHRSTPRFLDEGGKPSGDGHNERLEFLGDAVLDLAVSSMLFEYFPNASEGLLSSWRASLVNTRTLGMVGVELSLGEHLQMGKGEALSGGRGKTSILGNGMEAIFGAIFLDGGFSAAVQVAQRVLEKRLLRLDQDKWDKDYKTLLQELLQGQGRPLPDYRVVSVGGAPHEREFLVECLVEGTNPGIGSGRSKRMAEQTAAASVLLELTAVPQAG